MRTSLADLTLGRTISAGPRRARRARLLRWWRSAVVGVWMLGVGLGPVAANELDDAASQLVAISEKRDRISADRDAAEQRLTRVGLVARDSDARWREFTEDQQVLVRELDAAVSEARANAVLAYMWAGSRGPLDDLKDGGIDNSDGVRRHFAVGRVDLARDASSRLLVLVENADERQLLLARETSEMADSVHAATVDLDRLLDAERDAEQEVADAAAALAQAEQAESDRAAARAAAARAEARAKLPPPSELGVPSAEQWAKLRNCESTNNYQAVNPSGRYRGAYQFDLRTWQSMGGTGDPAAAPPAEQDRRAQMLYDARGRFPWPECGRFLP